MRQVCSRCGYAGDYFDDAREWASLGNECPSCCGPLSLQVERFHTVPNNLTNAEDLDSGDPYLWDQEIADNADDEEADGDGHGDDGNAARR